MQAVLNSKEKHAQLLLEAGADVEATDNHGCTALWYATSKQDCGLTELLLQHGADRETRNKMDGHPYSRR